MNKDRRKFLQVILIGSGTLLMGKVLGPLFSSLFNDPFTQTKTKTDPGVFKIVENKKRLSIFDDSGEEIFQIDNET